MPELEVAARALLIHLVATVHDIDPYAAVGRMLSRLPSSRTFLSFDEACQQGLEALAHGTDPA